MIISGGTILSSFLSGKVIKLWGTGQVTVVSVLMTAVALLGFGIAPSFLWLCLLAVPLGLGAGSVDAALNNFVALHYEAKHMNWLHCFWGIGATAGPVIMSIYLAESGGWSMGYHTIGILQICLVVILFASLPLWKKASSSSKTAVDQNHTNVKFKDLLTMKGARPALVSFFCYCALEATTGLWGSSYLVIERGISPEVAAQWISLFYLGITLGRLAAGFAVMWLRNVTMIRIGFAVIGGGVILLMLPLGNMGLMAGFMLTGIGCAPIYPCMLHQTPKNFGSHLSQAMMGIQMACAYIGTTFMPPLFGVLAATSTIALLPVYLLVILIVMAVMFERLNRAVQK